MMSYGWSAACSHSLAWQECLPMNHYIGEWSNSKYMCLSLWTCACLFCECGHNDVPVDVRTTSMFFLDFQKYSLLMLVVTYSWLMKDKWYSWLSLKQNSQDPLGDRWKGFVVCLLCIVWLLKYFPFLLNNIRKSCQYLLCTGLCFRPRHRWGYKHDWYTPFASRELQSLRLNHRCRPAEWGSHGTMYKPERMPGKRHWIRIGFTHTAIR